MSSDRYARFSCPACGASRLSTAIEYDDFGYSICPECRSVAGPGGDDRDPESDGGPTDWTWTTIADLADAEHGHGSDDSNGVDSSAEPGEYWI